MLSNRDCFYMFGLGLFKQFKKYDKSVNAFICDSLHNIPWSKKGLFVCVKLLGTPGLFMIFFRISILIFR